MEQFRSRISLKALLCLFTGIACSGTDAGSVPPSSGGSISVGGSSNGGSSTSNGDSSAAGAIGIGGTLATGGVLSTGGAINLGGTPGLGGNPTSAGNSSIGGRTATGGTKATGGASATGGMSAGGGTGGTTAAANCTDGASCLVPGSTCTSASGASCNCVGPVGAAIVVCYASGTGGATSSGGSPSTGGSSSKGGSSSTGGTKSTGGTVGTGGKGAAGGTTATGGSSGAVGVPCAGAAPFTSSAPATRITVDAGVKGAAWNRFYEKVVASDHANTVLTTAWGRNIQGALKKGHDQAGFQYVRFHGILDSDIGAYTETNGTAVYNWTRLDQVYDAIIAAGMRPFVEISFMPPSLASNTASTLHWYNNAPANISPPKDWNKWMAFMTALVQHIEAHYGADEIRNNWYFEVWNEASWMYTLGMAGYNELYGYTVRGLTAGDPLVKVGGPAEAGGGSPYAISSLVSYARTNSLKLDFVSYHYYGQDSTATNVALANDQITAHGTMMSTVNTSKFTGQVFCTEWGPAYSTPPARDNEIGASYVAKVVHRIGTSTNPVPPTGFGYWTISDYIEEFNSGNATAFRDGNWGMILKGDSRYLESFDVPKAPFNAFRLLHMLSDVNVSVSGGNVTNGVNAAATLASDSSSLQVLLYNHTDGGVADPTASSVVSVTLNNLPFSSTSLRARYYVLDHTRSNAYDDWVTMGRPSTPTQAQWVTLRDAAELCYYDTTATTANSSWTVSFPMNNYSVGLLVIGP